MSKKTRLLEAATVVVLTIALITSITACDGDDTLDSALTDNGTTLTVDEDGATSVDASQLQGVLDSLPSDEISAQEKAGLLFMREEEKLARDVYLTLYDTWNQKIFQNISNSEQTHTDAVLSLLQKYGIPDPVGDNAIGVFVDQDLQALNDSLVNTGNTSLIAALEVGTAIEEIDIIDLEKREAEIVGNDDIITVYEMLLKGSRNHLRAFVKNLKNQGIDYQPQYLSQVEYDEIINAATEQGN
ncbi:MAG TPA: DUF2202 domain-containing protein [Gammaproteobacteria bacterium]|nr:DUF2202 domain-containing protein [Gammaproteobacteria bacterium]